MADPMIEAQYTVSVRRFRWGTGLTCLTLVTVVFSLGIAVLPEEDMEGRMASITSYLPGGLVHTDPARTDKGVFKLTFWLFKTPGVPFHRNLQLQEQVLVAGEPAAEVIAALRSHDETKRAQGLEKITGLILTNRDLRGADLENTLFPKADLRGANLKGANLQGAQLQGADLRGAQLGSADLTSADLTLSNLQGLLRSPLDETAYKELAEILIPAIHDEQRRTALLERMKKAIGRDLQLDGASAAQVLCDDVHLFHSCLTPEKIEKYADDLAVFLETLGCSNGAIARGLVSRWAIDARERSSPLSPDDWQLLALAKRVTARPEKECPGWAALPADQKDALRKWATEGSTAP